MATDTPLSTYSIGATDAERRAAVRAEYRRRSMELGMQAETLRTQQQAERAAMVARHDEARLALVAKMEELDREYFKLCPGPRAVSAAEADTWGT